MKNPRNFLSSVRASFSTFRNSFTYVFRYRLPILAASAVLRVRDALPVSRATAIRLAEGSAASSRNRADEAYDLAEDTVDEIRSIAGEAAEAWDTAEEARAQADEAYELAERTRDAISGAVEEATEDAAEKALASLLPDALASLLPDAVEKALAALPEAYVLLEDYDRDRKALEAEARRAAHRELRNLLEGILRQLVD